MLTRNANTNNMQMKIVRSATEAIRNPLQPGAGDIDESGFSSAAILLAPPRQAMAFAGSAATRAHHLGKYLNSIFPKFQTPSPFFRLHRPNFAPLGKRRATPAIQLDISCHTVG